MREGEKSKSTREEESDKNRDRDRGIDIIGIIGSQRETLEAF